VLVVDDDREVVELLRRVLTSEDVEVVTAYNGDEALARCEEAPPAVLLVDLMMPKMDGEELLRNLRARLGEAMPPVVIVSASYQRTELSREPGVVVAIPKPFDLDDIRDTVAQILARTSRP
jgi:CheY-like chemotaxis protein